MGKKRAAPTGGERGGKKRRRGKKVHSGTLFPLLLRVMLTGIPDSVVHYTLSRYISSIPSRIMIQLNQTICRNGEIIGKHEELRRRKRMRKSGGREIELEKAGVEVTLVGRKKMRRKRSTGDQVSAVILQYKQSLPADLTSPAAPKGFAPPPMLYAPPPHSTGMAFRPIYPDEDDERPPPQQYPVSVPVPIAQSAEEAYQRRVAMSQMASKPPSFAPPTFTSAIRPPAFNPAPAFIAPIEEPAAAPPPLIPGSEEFERRKAEALVQVKARMAAIEAMKPTMGVGGTSSGTTDQSEKEDE